ncbi:MAG TPA: response regulator [Terriglobales bacterium]|nr:response regulator [Terriglobales bacterium]
MLGPFRARLGSGEAVTLPTRKTEALLAYVALAPGHVATRQSLAGLLWGDMPEEQARHNLRQALFALRRAIAGPSEAALSIGTSEIRIDPTATTIDVAEFERRLGDPATLAEGLALYEGDLLDGLDLDEGAFEQWLGSERTRLRERAVDAAGRLLRQLLDSDDVSGAIQAAVRLVGLDPAQEAGHRALMRLYARQGRRTAALRQYQVCAGVLRRELNATPSAETRKLHQEISVTPPAEAGAAVSQAALGPKSVLVVEDEAVARRLVERCLTGAGYKVMTAEDGAAALIALGAQRFDLVLSDIDMPNLDGLALLRVMSQRGIDTPAIFLTAMTGSEPEVEGLRLGASDYIRKPIHTEVLLLRVKNALRDGAV